LRTVAFIIPCKIPVSTSQTETETYNFTRSLLQTVFSDTSDFTVWFVYIVTYCIKHHSSKTSVVSFCMLQCSERKNSLNCHSKHVETIQGRTRHSQNNNLLSKSSSSLFCLSLFIFSLWVLNKVAIGRFILQSGFIRKPYISVASGTVKSLSQYYTSEYLLLRTLHKHSCNTLTLLNHCRRKVNHNGPYGCISISP
jgi:hypothetical protein